MAEPHDVLRFSVVISTCDRALSLRTLLDALRRQTYDCFEVLVVQGPCRDETPDLLERHTEVRSLECPERNLSKSRNTGIDAAAGDVVAFIDDDAIPEPRWLEELSHAYREEHVGGAGGLTLDPSGTRPQYRYSVCSRIGLTNFDQLPPLDRFNRRNADPFLYLQGTNCSFRREVLEAVGGFDEEIEYNYDESEVCSCVLDAGFELRALDDAVVHHKLLTSAMRREAGFTDPFFQMKNRAYFALRLGRDHASSAAIMASLTTYLHQIIASMEDLRQRGLFAEADLDAFVRRAEEGFALGVERGLAGVRKGRVLTPAHPEGFLQYPLLEPTDGRRLCVCFVSAGGRAESASGVDRSTKELANGVAAEGHEVHLVTQDDAGAYRSDYEDGVWVRRFPRQARHLPGLEQHPLAELLSHLGGVHNAVQAVADRAPVEVVAGGLRHAAPLLCALNPSWVTAIACDTSSQKAGELQPQRGASDAASWEIRLEAALRHSPAHLEAASRTNPEVRRSVVLYRELLERHRAPSAQEADSLTRERTTDMVASVVGMPKAAARAIADPLLDRDRFPIDYEHGIRTLLDVEDDNAFVDGLYRLLLGREGGPDVAGNYVDQILTGDRMAAVRTIVTSIEGRGRGLPTSVLDKLPLVYMKPAITAAEPAARSRTLRAALRRLRDRAVGVTATRASVADAQTRLLEANSAAARLVRRELADDLRRSHAELSSELADELDKLAQKVEHLSGSLREDNANLHEQLEAMTRKQEALASEVREKLSDTNLDELPDPRRHDRAAG